MHGFTLDPLVDEFRLTHPSIRMPARGTSYAVNDANWHHWDSAARAVVDRLRRPPAGPPTTGLRYSGALAADVHRALLAGGIYLYPAEPGAARATGKIRLLYEAAPLAFVVEQAGGLASTGTGRVLDVVAAHPHQRVPLFIGSASEVREAEASYARAAAAVQAGREAR